MSTQQTNVTTATTIGPVLLVESVGGQQVGKCNKCDTVVRVNKHTQKCPKGCGNFAGYHPTDGTDIQLPYLKKITDLVVN